VRSGCARHGMRRGHCKARCRMTRSRSSPGVPTRKIKRLRDADPCLLSPTSALERNTDSSQTSRQVRNVPPIPEVEGTHHTL
jgi:hypothetical protein